MHIDWYNLGYHYISCCCFTLDSKKFRTLLSEDVELRHQTNQEPIRHAKGIQTVHSLFEKYIFNNTTRIDLKSFSLKETKRGLVVKLIVEENKKGAEGLSRFLFNERTTFEFTNRKPFKIRSIHTKVLRKPC